MRILRRIAAEVERNPWLILVAGLGVAFGAWLARAR